MSNSLIPFGAGVAVGTLISGLAKVLLGMVVATGRGVAVYNLIPNKDTKEKP